MYESGIEDLLIEEANLEHKAVILSDPAFSSFIFNDLKDKYKCESLDSGVVLYFKENLFEAARILETYLKVIIAKFRKKANVKTVDFNVNFFEAAEEISEDKNKYVNFVYEF